MTIHHAARAALLAIALTTAGCGCGAMAPAALLEAMPSASPSQAPTTL